MSDGPVIYEVTLRPEAGIAAEFDSWLRKHARDMLELPGFLEASISTRTEDGADPNTAERIVQYRLVNRDALDAYLAEHAARMRAEGLAAFGERFTASRRILEGSEQLRAQPHAESICSNCESELHGQYCAACGQRSRQRMITVWELVREASDVLTSLDSRLWRTLGLLLFRPGRLTRNYLEGRRARYVAPLRLFIAASVIFFFTAAITAEFSADSSGVTINLEQGDEEEATPESTPPGAPVPDASEPAARQAVISDAGTTLDDAADADSGESGEGEGEGEGFDCDSQDLELNFSGPAWLEAFLTEERLRATCHKVVDDRGATLSRALLENIPVMMFIFLPFMAGIMKLLYPLSGRYYVEHLLFLVHYHSFFYLLATLALVVGWLGGRWFIPEWPGAVMTTVAMIYPPIYLYKAMREVYRQGRGTTVAKYFLLFIAYFVFLLITFLGTLTVTALTL